MADKKIHLDKGWLFPIHREGECSNCTKALPIGTSALYLDARVHNEDGWSPIVKACNQHDYWLFCSNTCLADFAQRSLQTKEEPTQAGDTPSSDT